MESRITLNLRTSRECHFTMKLRIPAWAGAVIRINSNRVAMPVQGGFAILQRQWRDGDRIEMNLPLQMRLEAINTKHPDTVALLRGPLVLFPITESQPAVKRQELLSAVQLSPQAVWQANTAAGPLSLLPFPGITDQRYTTYLKVS